MSRGAEHALAVSDAAPGRRPAAAAGPRAGDGQRAARPARGGRPAAAACAWWPGARRPARSAVQWVFEYDEGVDPADPFVRAAAETALAAAESTSAWLRRRAVSATFDPPKVGHAADPHAARFAAAGAPC